MSLKSMMIHLKKTFRFNDIQSWILRGRSSASKFEQLLFLHFEATEISRLYVKPWMRLTMPSPGKSTPPQPSGGVSLQPGPCSIPRSGTNGPGLSNKSWKTILMLENQQSNSGSGWSPWRIPNPEINRMGPKTLFSTSEKVEDDRNGLIADQG